MNRIMVDETLVSLEVEIPEKLAEAVLEYLDSHKEWDQGRLITAAIAAFLAGGKRHG